LEKLSWKPPSTENDPDDIQSHYLVFLFVSPVHTDAFSTLVEQAQKYFGRSNNNRNSNSTTQIIALIGGGVIGDGREVDNPQKPSLSILAGRLPSGARVQLQSWKNYKDESNNINSVDPVVVSPYPSDGSDSANDDHKPNAPVSYLIFGDPWSSMETLMKKLTSQSASSAASSSSSSNIIMAGGITCPALGLGSQLAAPPKSVAFNGHVLDAGSAVMVQLSGTISLQTLVAQGCRPVSPPYTITAGEGNIIESLNGRPALQVLQELTANCPPNDAQLIRQELLCGIAIPSQQEDEDSATTTTTNPQRQPSDYLCRQLIGFVPAIQGIAIAAKIQEGDTFVFQVRDQTSALNDMKLMVQRAKAARLFYHQPSTIPRPLAALQISCVARGTGLFRIPNADVTQLQELVVQQNNPVSNDGGGSIPIGGFFANGEIGPVGLAGFSPPSQIGGGAVTNKNNNYIHGFTTVAAILCETTTASSGTAGDTTMTHTGEAKVPTDLDAWG
jgi:small ligand-binding sensory domain FIST